MGGATGRCGSGSPLPAFAFPEPAAAVLGRSYAYGTWLQHEAARGGRRRRRHRPGQGRRRDRRRPRARRDAARHGRGRRRAVGLRHRRARRRRAARPPTPSPPPTRSATRSPSRPQHRHLGRSVRAGVALDLGDADDVVHAAGRDAGRHRRRRRQRRRPGDGPARASTCASARTTDERLGPLVDDRARQLDRRPRQPTRRRGWRRCRRPAPRRCSPASRAGPALINAGLDAGGRASTR